MSFKTPIIVNDQQTIVENIKKLLSFLRLLIALSGENATRWALVASWLRSPGAKTDSELIHSITKSFQNLGTPFYDEEYGV